MVKIFSTANQENKENNSITTIYSTLLPNVLWNYSKSKKAWNLVFCSWQIWINPLTNELISWELEEQARQSCRNIRSVLLEYKLWLKDVVKTTIYLSDIDNLKKIDSIIKDYFVLKPASTLLEIKSLAKGALIEIEAIAYIK